MCHIEIWLYPQCMASSVTGPLDVFAVANAIWAAQTKSQDKNHYPIQNQHQPQPLFSWSLRSLDGAPVTTPTGIRLHADGPLGLADAASMAQRRHADVILLPGIYAGNGMRDILAALASVTGLYPVLREQHRQGSLLAANCSATVLLAEAGLLRGGHATTTWWLHRAFQARYPDITLHTNDILNEYQGILTSGAATAYLDLALHLTARYAGQEIAARVAKTLLIDANRSSQAPFMSLSQQESQAHSDTLVLRAQHWMQKHVHLPFQLTKMASHLAVTERTVIRHFHQALQLTPTAYMQQLKIELARRLLENTTLSLDQVCERTGYLDPSSFRRLFKRHTALSPAQYRLQFRQKKVPPGKPEPALTTTVVLP
ncbi:GlxA family transcriptional regulator [soil metagenome]